VHVHRDGDGHRAHLRVELQQFGGHVELHGHQHQRRLLPLTLTAA
jgi:hypothetical protein